MIAREESERGSAWIWTLGVFFVIVSSVVSSLDVNLQKKSFLLQARCTMSKKRSTDVNQIGSRGW